jgi:hypothetical protein
VELQLLGDGEDARCAGLVVAVENEAVENGAEGFEVGADGRRGELSLIGGLPRVELRRRVQDQRRRRLGGEVGEEGEASIPVRVGTGVFGQDRGTEGKKDAY